MFEGHMQVFEEKSFYDLGSVAFQPTELENQISVLASQTSILLSCHGSSQQTAHKDGLPSGEPVLGKVLRTGLLCCASESGFKVVCDQAELSRGGSYIKL